jgi:hypothetical protein
MIVRKKVEQKKIPMTTTASLTLYTITTDHGKVRPHHPAAEFP